MEGMGGVAMLKGPGENTGLDDGVMRDHTCTMGTLYMHDIYC